MAAQGAALLCLFLMLCRVSVMDGKADGCKCPPATVLTQLPSAAPPGTCCLNYSGSSFESVTWTMFVAMRDLEILDLSFCNISQVLGDTASPPHLREVYLGANRLRAVPVGFLRNASHLRLLDLGWNLLERLPEDFLQGSALLQQLLLDSNQLSTLPNSIFQMRLKRLDLSNNPWECSCVLMQGLEGQRHLFSLANSTDWQVGNPTCSSPRSLAGQVLWSVLPSKVCWSPGLTALCVLLPLLIFLALVLYCCCGRKRKRKEGKFNITKQPLQSPPASGPRGAERDRRHTPKHHQAEQPAEGGKDALLKNQLMLRPSSALLGSSRDLYEEVEVQVGSEGSLAPASLKEPPADPGLEAEGAEDGKADLDTVSVTEVMQDSTNREKAYLAQSTEYYSLVPGMDLEDSDHGEYESVPLS
ncbi:leucine-rich repeat, immunoglobulin-like domain and transmembrane domain-containing protein 2 [Scleropages formosus]|uniref:Leucine-rich repeat, immunoglobulin-like domain and transmembrane domain-containing protein 2 n=1 Tax=Scleropages formosus TaxID=113540 RepID=A0A8C9U2J5_SCLFO|nr:leucine-rich repeat, immunoglobulin-like domain and transmembrane domain-containing protein 2 [Scleropages formosus]XP_018608733.2 leucine-rich repeat, immunoglobulin-like domain and transmembrane domain-containing protein 2 [Scleropages formosus]